MDPSLAFLIYKTYFIELRYRETVQKVSGVNTCRKVCVCIAIPSEDIFIWDNRSSESVLCSQLSSFVYKVYRVVLS